jgi:hypothetical protein
MIYGQYRFCCRFKDEAMLPEYKGSTFRGVFGGALKRVSCPLKQQACDTCLLKTKCVYPLIFTPEVRPETKSSGGKAATPPPPMVLVPPATKQARFSIGDAFDFDLLLFGKVNDSLPYFVYAFEQTGKMGIGKKINDGRRAGFLLESVNSGRRVIYSAETGTLETKGTAIDLTPQPVDPGAGGVLQTVTITLETPLRVKYHNRLVSDLPFHVFARACLRRIADIYNYYGEGEPAWDYPGLVAAAEQVQTARHHLTWKDWERYSGRQNDRMKFGGLVGTSSYADVPGYFRPIIELAEKLHIGKQTTFGLGKFHAST